MRAATESRGCVASVLVVAVADLDLDAEVSRSFCAPSALCRTNFTVPGALPYVTYIPMTIVVCLLYDLSAHRHIVLAWDQWICLVVEEVGATFVVERVALVAFDWFRLVWAPLYCIGDFNE